MDPQDAGGIEAVQAFETSVRLNPKFAPARTELGKLFLKRGEVGRAIEELQRAVALDPDEAGALYVLGQAYRKSGDRLRAKETLNKVRKRRADENPTESDEGLKRVVVRLVKEGMSPASPTPFAVSAPESPAPHLARALEYGRTGRMADAVFEYHEALRLQPDLTEARYGLSLLCTRIGDLDGAIELLRQVIKTTPRFAEAYYNLGLNLWNRFRASTGPQRTNDLNDAMDQLRIAIELGRVAMEMRDWKTAATALKAAVVWNADDANARENLAIVVTALREGRIPH